LVDFYHLQRNRDLENHQSKYYSLMNVPTFDPRLKLFVLLQ
jgi:hypothetical protein